MPIARPTFKYSVVVVKYSVVAVDYFTKWAEPKPLAVDSSKKVQEFIWESIICHFEIPYEIISDNET